MLMFCYFTSSSEKAFRWLVSLTPAGYHSVSLWQVYERKQNRFRCDLVSSKLWEAIEREDALHWLSTLGGAFSNLGENNLEFVRLDR